MMQAHIWYLQLRLEDARSEALLSIEIFEKLGVAGDVTSSKSLLQKIERAAEKLYPSQVGFSK